MLASRSRISTPPVRSSWTASAGAAPGDLRSRAGDPEFLGFVLDFLLADEKSLVAFTASESVSPDAPMRARAALPGGDLPNWT